jgi:arylsulfatase A-like enzyme
MIVVTSDHGESFGERRLLGHGRALYEELVRVPLIIKYPSADGRKGIVERRVSTVGIMPTVLEYVGLPIPRTVASETLDDEEQILIAESTRDVAWVLSFGKRFDRDLKAAYDGNYKFVWNSEGDHELYDIVDDPAEENNLYGEKPDLEKRFMSRLAPLIEESQSATALDLPEIDPATRENLKKLGYLQ